MWLFGFLFALAVAPAGELRLRFPEDLGPTPVLLEVQDGEGAVRALTVTGDNPSLSLPGPGPWHLKVLSPSFWPTSVTVPVPVPSGAEVRFFWQAQVVFSFKGHEDTLPGVKAVLFPARDSAGPPWELSCTRGGKEWRCSAPAGEWRGKLVIPGFVSFRIDKLRLNPGRATELADIPLRVEARVTGVLTPAPDPPVSISLLPVKTGFPVIGPEDDPFYREEVFTDREGAFSFAGLEGGSYELRLSSGCGARLLRFSLAASSTLALPVLNVACGGSLRVRISPQLTGAWEVLVFAEDSGQGVRKPVVHGRVNDGGTWESSPLPEGTYSVLIHNAEGEALSVAQVWLGAAGATVAFGDAGFTVRGAILYGDKPWKGRFRFVKTENAAFEVHVNTDEEGRFSAYLPEKGRWWVSPLADSTRFENALSFEAKPGRTLAIAFPATHLSGYVHSEGMDSGPLFVYVLGRAAAVSGSSQVKGDGHFEVRGLPEGEYWVQAVGPAGISQVFAVGLVDGEPLSLDLALMPFSFVTLELSDGEKPVAGALVHYTPLGEGLPAQLLPPIPVTSDTDGRARLPIPTQAVAVSGMVLAPPLAVQGFFSRAPLPSSLPMTLSPRGGTLVLPRNLVVGSGEKPRSYLLPMSDDYVLDVFHDVTSWREAYGTLPGLEGTILPMAAPGHYRLCLVPAERLWEALGVMPKPHNLSCTSGKLLPNGILRLAPPKGATQ
ncbi:MAG: hypothetical protein ACK42L_01435 [Thermoanaerobaculum sp.]